MHERAVKPRTALGRRRAWTVAGAIASVIAISACGSGSSNTNSTQASSTSAAAAASSSTPSSSAMPGKGKPTIVLGDKNFTEEFVLGDIYAEAFRAKGYTVKLKPNIGSSELINRVLQSGQINAYPEYLGEIASSLAGYSKPITSEAQTMSLSQAYENKHGFTVMTPVTPFQDRDQIAALKSYASKHNLTSDTQLKNLGPVKLGDYSAEETRYEGYVGLKKVYGATNLQFVPLQAGGPIYQALDSGQVQVGDVFSTDPQLLSGKYQALSDPQNIMGFQHVGMVIKTSLLHQLGPAFQSTYASVTKLLTTPAMQALNKAVAIDKLDPATVAHKFLQENHLL
ncbi:MAG TPA: glycine betaine ABC transporter substrate-binding protein [Solirubrobacteraceae bacterium]|nr:glycine betaine ABC transporter substrate-binding protein [Solirubrobacteraceae bacterium]